MANRQQPPMHEDMAHQPSSIMVSASENEAKPTHILGPTGEIMTLDDLPPNNTRRWVIRRKAQVVAGVRQGLISLEDACNRYKLSVEEFASWQKLIEDHGLRGLRTTRLQQYRENLTSLN